MILTLLIATLILVVLTLLPLWRNPHWLVRGMDFPRLQLTTLAMLLLLAQLVLLDLTQLPSLGLTAVTAACLVWQLWWILPYTRIWAVEVRQVHEGRPDRRLRILTANVLTSNRNAEALLELVERFEPDVLVTLESDQWWQDQLDTLQTQMPHAIKCPLDNLYGMHVYSRLPLAEAEVNYLVEDDKPSMHALVTLRSGDPIRMHFLHPAPPSPSENPESGERDAELIIVAKSVSTSDQPVVVTGDLNDVAWSSTTRLFRKLSGLLDPRVGRGMFNTFHADYPFLRWPLDHVFHSSHFVLASIERMPPIGSDHFALLTELEYAPTMETEQDGIDADSDDRSRGRAIAREQDVSAGDVAEPGE